MSLCADRARSGGGLFELGRSGRHTATSIAQIGPIEFGGIAGLSPPCRWQKKRNKPKGNRAGETAVCSPRAVPPSSGIETSFYSTGCVEWRFYSSLRGPSFPGSKMLATQSLYLLINVLRTQECRPGRCRTGLAVSSPKPRRDAIRMTSRP